MFSKNIRLGMSSVGGLNCHSLSRVKMKADFSFENNYQKMPVVSSALQKISKKYILMVEAYSEKENS